MTKSDLYIGQSEKFLLSENSQESYNTTDLIGAEFVVPFSSRSLALKSSWKSHQMTPFLFKKRNRVKKSLFEWKHCHISFKWWSFHPIPIFERKKCHLMTFFMTTWERENESERKKEPQIPRHSVLKPELNSMIEWFTFHIGSKSKKHCKKVLEMSVIYTSRSMHWHFAIAGPLFYYLHLTYLHTLRELNIMYIFFSIFPHYFFSIYSRAQDFQLNLVQTLGLKYDT